MKSYFLRRAVSRGARRRVSFGHSKSAVSFSKSKSGILKPSSQHQLGQKPSSTSRRRPGMSFPVWNCCTCKYFTLLMTLLLFTGAIVMIILYLLKLKKLSERANAIVAIRKFMIHHNRSFEGKSDAVILAGAQQLAKYLLDGKSENDEVQHALNSAIEKLAMGWKPFKGHLYLFSKSALSFLDASQKCQDIGGMLVDITSDEEEDFVETETRKDYSAYWIGIMFKGGLWTWLNGQILRSDYWMDTKPDSWGGSEPCVEIHRCVIKRKCWNDVRCDETKKWICKMKPNPKWL